MQDSNSIKQAFPELEASDSIRQATRASAGVQVAGRRHKSKMRRTFVAAVATGALVTAGVFAGPPAYGYYRMHQIAGSVEDCQSAVITMFHVAADGSVHPSGTGIVYCQGQWRIQDGPKVEVYSNKLLWAYDPATNQVTKMLSPAGPFGYNHTGFSISAMIADHKRWNWNDKISSGSDTFQGKTVETLTIQTQDDSRSRVLADPKTHMPFRMESESKTADGNWRLDGITLLEFNTRIDPKTFALDFPANAKIVDTEAIKAGWAGKVEKPIATLTAPNDRIVIRDIAINERGHIFIVFTDGETENNRAAYAAMIRAGKIPRTYHVTPQWNIRDSAGTEYWSAGPGKLQPYTGGFAGERSKWIVLSDGEVLQGEWLIPKTPVSWTPRKLTMSCTIARSEDRTSEWTLDVTKPTTPMLPDWVHACALAPRTPKDVLDEEARVRQNQGMTFVSPHKPRQ